MTRRYHRPSDDQAVTRTEFNEFRNEVREDFSAIMARLNQPQDLRGLWMAALGTISLIMVIGGAVVAPIYSAISANQTYIRSDIDARAASRERDGTMLKQLEWHGEWLRFIEQQVDAERATSSQLSERLSRMEGRHEMLVDRVKDIDDRGSRVWNQNREGQ